MTRPPDPDPERPAPPAPPAGLTPVGDDEDDDVLVDSRLTAKPKPAAADTPEPPGELPPGWQFGLVALLAKLESLRGQFAGCRYGPDAAHLLDRVEAMVLLTEEFSRQHDYPDASTDTQMDALAKAGAFYVALNDTRRPTVGRSLLKSMLSKMTAPEPVSGAAVRECVAAGIEALHAYFTLFTEVYRSSLKARSWVDAASAFLADFKQMARAMPEG